MADGLHVPPCRPYIVRALYDWMVDNHMTPQITVNVNCPNVELPLQYAQNGVIVLNISPNAVRNLVMDNEAISFSARFGGVPHEVYVPMFAVTTIYPREDISLGMCLFPERAYDEMFYDDQKNKSHLSAVEDIDNKVEKMPFEIIDSGFKTQKSESQDNKPSIVSSDDKSSKKERKKPTLEIVE